MDATSVAYVLCRIEDDASLTPVSQHEDILTAIAAGGYAVEVEDLEFAYALYAGDPSNGSYACDPLRAGVPLPGLRFFYVEKWGWGWVAKIGGRTAGGAHLLEKSAPVSWLQAYIV